MTVHPLHAPKPSGPHLHKVDAALAADIRSVAVVSRGVVAQLTRVRVHLGAHLARQPRLGAAVFRLRAGAAVLRQLVSAQRVSTALARSTALLADLLRRRCRQPAPRHGAAAAKIYTATWGPR